MESGSNLERIHDPIGAPSSMQDGKGVDWFSAVLISPPSRASHMRHVFYSKRAVDLPSSLFLGHPLASLQCVISLLPSSSRDLPNKLQCMYERYGTMKSKHEMR